MHTRVQVKRYTMQGGVFVISELLCELFVRDLGWPTTTVLKCFPDFRRLTCSVVGAGVFDTSWRILVTPDRPNLCLAGE